MYEDFTRQMVDEANQHLARMQGMTSRQAMTYVKRIIERSAIVMGVYRDATSPNGVGMHIIKGVRQLQVVIASGKSDQFTASAVPCECLEQAIAAEQKLGDGCLKAN